MWNLSNILGSLYYVIGAARLVVTWLLLFLFMDGIVMYHRENDIFFFPFHHFPLLFLTHL